MAPDRFNPTRIGLVFYQHKRLCFDLHGFHDLKERRMLKMRRDYENYLDGTFVPTSNQLKSMIDAGYEFGRFIAVTRSGKPRGNNGHELPDDLSDHHRPEETPSE